MAPPGKGVGIAGGVESAGASGAESILSFIVFVLSGVVIAFVVGGAGETFCGEVVEVMDEDGDDEDEGGDDEERVGVETKGISIMGHPRA